MSNAIEVHEIAKTFKGGVRALDGVSFVVEEGTIFGLLGPNGAGKTTVIRVLTTILRPDSGTATVFGHDVVAEARLVRTLFGLAGQYAAVDENLTARENLKLVGRLNHLDHGTIAARSGVLLEQFDLVSASDRPLKTFSGGMRRRLDLAASLVARPRVLFLDEPTTGLDPQSRLVLWEVIEQLVKAGTTVLLTTQYLEEADRLAEQLAVVHHGQVIAQGTPPELKANLGATVLDIGFSSPDDALVAAQALDGMGRHAPHVLGSTVELNVDVGPRTAMEALRVLDQRQLEPVTFNFREPSLDDVFLALTGTTTEDSASSDTTNDSRADRTARRTR